MSAKRIKRPGDSVFLYSNLHGSAEKHRKIADTQTRIELEHIKKPELDTIEQPKTPDWEYDGRFLDLAFAMDCTGSMGSYIDTARDNIRQIVEEIVASENCDVRLALVEYRDHPPQDRTFVTRVHDFTESLNTMKEWLTTCTAKGGGDRPEAVADALHDILSLRWREYATKICVCVSDAPPHGLGINSDGFPGGCPVGIDPMEVTHRLAEEGITLYVVGCEPSILDCKEFFMALAFITGGQYVPLTRAQLLTRVIIGGAREEMSLEQAMAEVDEDVQQEIAAGRVIDDAVFAGFSQNMHSKLKSQGIQTNHLRRNQAALDTVDSSPVAKKLTSLKTLAAVRTQYSPTPPAHGCMFGGFSSGTPADRSVGSGGGGVALFGTAAPAGSLGFGGATSSFGDEYDCVSGNISYAQTSRMVQKSIARNSAKKK